MAKDRLEAPIEAYEVTGAATVRSRLHAAAARGLTRFVGRDSKLEQLRQALECPVREVGGDDPMGSMSGCSTAGPAT